MQTLSTSNAFTTGGKSTTAAVKKTTGAQEGQDRAIGRLVAAITITPRLCSRQLHPSNQIWLRVCSCPSHHLLRRYRVDDQSRQAYR